jgi:hypothetical protein
VSQELSLNMPGLEDCRRQTLGDPDICIAVIDSRVDLSHPCFSGAQLREIMPAWLLSVMGASGASHGTHVASVIFGQPGGPVEGIAPRCRGIIIPVYGETEEGELRPCSQEDLARAIALALEAGAHLINISGGELIRPGDVDRHLAQIVATCDRQDVAIVAATGNEGCECLHVPAALPTVLAIGAGDATGQPMPFSNWDASLASHGILAPGEEIIGAVPGNGAAPKTGTSFACPIVTGAAALLLSLQKLSGERPSPKAVRDAIIGSAVPCGPEEQAHCERMLGGRVNIAAAHELLFKNRLVSPSAKGVPANAIRSPPTGAARGASARWDASNHPFITPTTEGAVMADEQVQGYPQGAARTEQAAAPQGFEAVHAGMQAQPSAIGMWAPPAAAGATPVASPMAPPGATQWIAAAGQPAAVQPQGAAGGCGCGGAQSQQGTSPSQQFFVPVQPPQGMNPSQQVFMPAQQGTWPAQQGGWPVQQPVALAHHGGIPMQAPVGVQSDVTPAKRTAMITGFHGSGGPQHSAMPADRGVAPSQTHTSIPMPTDFIDARNSQLVYVIGELGYDFITDARRDYFVQQFAYMQTDEPFIQQFTHDLGLVPGNAMIPEDHRAMAAYLSQARRPTPDLPGRPGTGHPGTPLGLEPEATGSVVWTLNQEGQQLYALKPLHTFAAQVLVQLANVLYDQSRPEFLDHNTGNATDVREENNPNPERSERVSVAGRIIGDITLYNGQQVPVLDVSLRALFWWTTKLILDDALGPPPLPDAPERPAYDLAYDGLKNFLERVYYEVRNMGQAPSDRAINYLATNAFQVADAFKKAAHDKLTLDSIFAEKSPICRPKSDCWDVVMRFFDPEHRMDRALDEYRLTVDVTDMSPVGIGKLRQWARYA